MPSASAAVASGAPSVNVDARPDEASALVTARIQGTRVEIANAQTTTSRTWANPDGSLTVQQYSGPNWVQQADGSWNEIDTNLVANGDSTFTPVEAPMHVVVGAPAEGSLLGVQQGSPSKLATLATMSNLDGLSEAAPASASIALGWPGNLPVPTIDGSEATFASVTPNEDIRIKVLPTGLESFVDIKSRPTDVPAGGYVVNLPLSAKGLTVRDKTDGTVELVNQQGEVVLETPRARIWDASIDTSSGVSHNEIAVNTELVKLGGSYALRVVVPSDYLENRDLVYPVTVDPTYTSQTLADTFIEKGYDTTNFYAADDLRVGTYDAGTHIARSYLKFDLSSASNFVNPNTVVTAANLHLYEWHSASCATRQIDSHRATAFWSSSVITWDTRAAYESSPDGSAVEAHGFSSSCPDAWLNGSTGISVKYTVTAWAHSGYPTSAPNYGVVLDAANETDSLSWKRFYSSDYATSSKRPYLTYSYVHRPVQPSVTTVTGLNKSAAGKYYTNVTRPTVTDAVSDVDGGSLIGRFQLYSSSGAAIGSTFDSSTRSGNGTTPPVTIPVTLSSGSTYKVRGYGFDGTYVSDPYTTSSGASFLGYSDSPSFTVDTVLPTVSALSCTGLTLQGVNNTPPTSATCQVSVGDALSGPGTTAFAVDDLAPLTSTGSTSSVSLTSEMLTTGYHTITATASDVAGNKVDVTAWYFVSDAALNQPTEGYSALSVVPVELVGPTGSTGYSLTYSLDNGATFLPMTKVTNVSGNAWSGGVTQSLGKQTSGTLTWDMATELGTSSARAVLVRGCFTGYQTGSFCGSRHIIRQLHAFGGSSATTNIGVGTLSLATGELSMSSVDGTVAVGDSSISLGRSWLSFPDSQSASKFGPGWVEDLPVAGDGGAATAQIVDTSQGDGLITLKYSDGTSDQFECFSNCGASSATFVPVGEAALAHMTLTRDATKLAVTDGSFVTTTWLRNGAAYTSPTVSDPAGGFVSKTLGPATLGTFAIDGVAYTGDTYASVVISKVSSGVNCTPVSPASSPTLGLVAGCVALTYITAKSSTIAPSASNHGDYPNQMRAVLATMFNPATNSMETKTVSRYAYDSLGYLVEQWDPRTALSSGNLVTQYTYGATVNGVRQLIAVTPASSKSSPLAPTAISYDQVGRVLTFGRSGGGTTTVQYESKAPINYPYPDLSSAKLSLFGQLDLPTHAVVLFPPAADTSDVKQGTVYGLDYSGWITNVANYSAGLWHTSIVNHDSHGLVEWSMSPSNVDRAQTVGGLPDDPMALPVGSVQDRARLLRTENTYSTADLGLLIQKLGPMTDFIDSSGIQQSGREVSLIVNDVDMATLPGPSQVVDAFGIAHSGPWRVPIQSTTGMAVLTTTSGSNSLSDAGGQTYDPIDTQVTNFGYGAVGGGTSGWLFAVPTTVTIQMGAVPSSLDITTSTKLDAYGRVVETRQPMSSGTDSGTIQTIYYTNSANLMAPSCGGKPAWEGRVCMEQPVSAGTNPQLVPTKTYAYDLYGALKSMVETANSATRTTTTTYDSGQRVTNESVVISGPNVTVGSTSTSTSYSPSTGLATRISRGSQSIAQTYDTFGRVATQTDASGNVATTNYDSYGRLLTENDGISTTTYSYNGVDRNGVAQFPGRVTGKTVASSLLNGSTVADASFAASYNADGLLASQSFPNGIKQQFTYNPSGQADALDYVDSTQSLTLASFSRSFDASGQVVADNGLTKSAAYVYDDAGRLVQSQQTVDGNCIVHQYTFDKDSNRTNLQTLTNVDGSCPLDTATADAATNVSRVFDSADRITVPGAIPGYAYDSFGNTVVVPSADSANHGADVTLAYQPDNQVQSITQTGFTRTFTQDPLDRTTLTVESSSGGVSTALNFYGDSSDSPAWTLSSGNKWSHPITDLQGNLAVIANGTASSGAATSTKTLTSSAVQIVDLHGDVVATMDTTTGANTFASTTAYDEYGAVLSSQTSPRPSLGWLGAQERYMTNAGLFLMGVRLYNPATGRFLQVDPVPGGSPSAYAYPTDPILMFDLSGTDWTNWASDFLSRASLFIWMASALTPCTAVCVGLGLVVGVASVSLDFYHKDKTALALDSVGLLTGGLSATAGHLVSRAARDASGVKRITKIVHGRVYQQVTRIIKVADHASNGTNFIYYMYSQWKQITPRKR
jgi:RHS repeat-associated protein